MIMVSHDNGSQTFLTGVGGDSLVRAIDAGMSLLNQAATRHRKASSMRISINVYRLLMRRFSFTATKAFQPMVDPDQLWTSNLPSSLPLCQPVQSAFYLLQTLRNPRSFS
jgi:hypothetical protein